MHRFSAGSAPEETGAGKVERSANHDPHPESRARNSKASPFPPVGLSLTPPLRREVREGCFGPRQRGGSRRSPPFRSCLTGQTLSARSRLSVIPAKAGIHAASGPMASARRARPAVPLIRRRKAFAYAGPEMPGWPPNHAFGTIGRSRHISRRESGANLATGWRRCRAAPLASPRVDGARCARSRRPKVDKQDFDQ